VQIMKNEQAAHMRSAAAALSIGVTLTLAACAQDAAAPSGPSPAPQRPMSVLTTVPAVGSPVVVPAPTTQFVPEGSLPTVAGTPPTDIAIGEIGPQPPPGTQIVVVPEGDWVEAAPPPPPETGPPETGIEPPYGDIIFTEQPPESPESPAIIGDDAPHAGPIDGE
jgi:hypothetical protein